MIKYKNVATVAISVDLPTNHANKYSVTAFAQWNKEKSCYEVTLYLKRADIDILELIEKAEKVLFETATASSIRGNIASYIEKLISDNFFSYYIDRYEYEQKCFDRGNDLFENEGLTHNVK